MRKNIPNLFIVGGDGRNSGKTSMVCRIIAQLRESRILAAKISPHFHQPSPGLILIESGEGYNIFIESNMWSAKDTSRMLQGGADKVFYLQVSEEFTEAAFEKIMDLGLPGTPVVVESPSLIRYFDPGVFVLMLGSDHPSKELSEIECFAHLSYTIEELDNTSVLPFIFIEGKWIVKDK